MRKVGRWLTSPQKPVLNCAIPYCPPGKGSTSYMEYWWEPFMRQLSERNEVNDCCHPIQASELIDPA